MSAGDQSRSLRSVRKDQDGCCREESDSETSPLLTHFHRQIFIEVLSMDAQVIQLMKLESRFKESKPPKLVLRASVEFYLRRMEGTIQKLDVGFATSVSDIPTELAGGSEALECDGASRQWEKKNKQRFRWLSQPSLLTLKSCSNKKHHIALDVPLPRYMLLCPAPTPPDEEAVVSHSRGRRHDCVKCSHDVIVVLFIRNRETRNVLQHPVAVHWNGELVYRLPPRVPGDTPEVCNKIWAPSSTCCLGEEQPSSEKAILKSIRTKRFHIIRHPRTHSGTMGNIDYPPCSPLKPSDRKSRWRSAFSATKCLNFWRRQQHESSPTDSAQAPCQ